MITTTHSHKHWTDEGGHVTLARWEATIPEVEATEERQTVVVARAFLVSAPGLIRVICLAPEHEVTGMASPTRIS